MQLPLPRRSVWRYSSPVSPAVSAFPDRVVKSACATSVSRIAQHSLTLKPVHSLDRLKATPYLGGFSHFVTSMTAPNASGRSDLAGWVFHPLEKRRLITAHTQTRHRKHLLNLPTADSQLATSSSTKLLLLALCYSINCRLSFLALSLTRRTRRYQFSWMIPDNIFQ